MDLSEKLIQLGFSHNQAIVYKALIEIGQCKAQAIIKKTNLHRNIVYEALEVLVEKHLAFKTTKGGVALFQLSDANTLVQDAKSQLTAAQEVAHEINSLRQESTHEIKLYEGVEGLKSHRYKILDDIKKSPEGGELLVLGVHSKANQEPLESFWEKFHHKRAAEHIPARMLFPTDIDYTVQKRNKIPFTKVRLLPQQMKNPSSIDIWKDQVAFMLYDIEPFIIAIKNQTLANSFREYFEMLWGQDTSVITGLEALKKLRYQKLRALKKGDQFSVLWGNYEPGTEKELFPFFKAFHKERVEEGVRLQYLGFEKDRDLLMQEMQYAGDPELKISELKFSDTYNESPMQIEIYPDSVVLFYWAQGEKAVAVDIRRREIRGAMKLYFDALWKQDTQLISGRENVEQLIFRKLDEMKKGDTYYVYGGQYGEKNPEHFFQFFCEYQKKKNKLGIRLQMIGFEDVRKQLLEEVRSGDPKLELSKVRFLDQELLTPSLTIIYPKSALLILWDYDEALAIETTRESARQMLLKHFQSLWKIAKK
ncbi:MAG: hypothetical protein A2233_04870 [Candidatus Kerfeldbacteria bacterium RIFOXYA2_FULL_38_24]|uniref:Transcription regulator TrmB N-terminal domain-containing protein n=1 Tax=Candidatus Kerfeldbacteria bacterium RIFOXYB2_FULL_38_14 TaxID=1798547 RepID=A0A1G2BFS7_9BACT|nr:MAG: hypothetical protein A2319_02210 [Candidatus Kerfeldbacteria bacterium RIFOXYB2_FULL_38_14]OGY88203.1 MAG: hypothetical protein A2233_04870 [Candidatus Kerfeldbacteria bacterium RIFOXYA2_FULL_38_24]OGY89223.1 MAG: hypothetical protein A2458_01345 [Candidatus Kerfeldbacteria bacterium RIFOXYC2_FULL_38_9]